MFFQLETNFLKFIPDYIMRSKPKNLIESFYVRMEVGLVKNIFFRRMLTKGLQYEEKNFAKIQN